MATLSAVVTLPREGGDCNLAAVYPPLWLASKASWKPSPPHLRSYGPPITQNDRVAVSALQELEKESRTRMRSGRRAA